MSRGDADAYLQFASDHFAALADRTVSHDYLVAGKRLRVDVARDAPERALCRALAHLEIAPAGAADMTIAVWDSASSGAPPLKPAWSVSEYGAYGAVDGFNDERFFTAVQLDPIIFEMLDRTERRALFWTPDVEALPIWERGAPLRRLFHEWLRGEGFLPIHGGAVGYADGGVLLAGAGGSGKSNVALTCLRSDLYYASDDFCVVARDPAWRVHSLYSTGKIAGADLARHPELADHVSNRDALDRDKALFFLHETYPEKIIRTMPLKAILMPRVAGGGISEIVPAGAAEAQRAIAMSTIELSRWTGAFTFAQVAGLVRALPCFSLRIGEDYRNVPRLISDLLSELG